VSRWGLVWPVGSPASVEAPAARRRVRHAVAPSPIPPPGRTDPRPRPPRGMRTAASGVWLIDHGAPASEWERLGRCVAGRPGR